MEEVVFLPDVIAAVEDLPLHKSKVLSVAYIVISLNYLSTVLYLPFSLDF